MTRRAYVSLSVLGSAITIVLSGCAGVTRWGTVSRNHPRTLTTTQLVEHAGGIGVRLKLRDGRVMEGTLLSTGYMPEATYAPRYTSWRDSSSAAAGVPALGDTVLVRRGKRSPLRGSFRGFSHGELLVTPAGSAGIAHAALSEVEMLSVASGTEVEGERLASLEKSGRLPRASVAWVAVGRDTTMVPVDDISLALSLGPRYDTGVKVASWVLAVPVAAVFAAAWLAFLYSFGK